MTDISAAIEPAVEPAPVGRLSARAARRRKTVATVLAVAILRFGTSGDQRFQVAFDAGSIAPLGTTLLYPLVGARRTAC